MKNKDHRDIHTLLEVMATMRDPVGGCPWDREQDFQSIAPYTIEEAYEVADAIERNNLPELCDELGDLLLQVVFHAQMASEIGAFDFGDVVAAINGKMIRRHPHVFGTATVTSADAQHDAWETLKARERASSGTDSSALAGVGLALPALTRAAKLGKRAARVGFDWDDLDGVIDKIHEEIGEVRQEREQNNAEALEAEIGDLLLSCVSLARHCEVDPEQALRLACRKFESRFRHVEAALQARNQAWDELTLADMDVLWERAKRSE